MSNTVTGTIKIINDAQTYGSFTKREFIVSTEGKYPQDIKLELYQEKCPDLDAYSVGDAVDVEFNLKGNEYKGKYYVNLQAWKINSQDSTGATQEAAPPAAETPDLTEGDEELEDVPF
jgi:hypothetical protein